MQRLENCERVLADLEMKATNIEQLAELIADCLGSSREMLVVINWSTKICNSNGNQF